MRLRPHPRAPVNAPPDLHGLQLPPKEKMFRILRRRKLMGAKGNQGAV
jgi:hypothetical protein